jgi:4-amino-4-deoxy-L-arabinose transferase-like glycosyltransferase
MWTSLRRSAKPSLGRLLLFALLMLGAGIGLRDPSPPDEPRFVLAARHMVDSGQWLLPYRGSEIYSHKPPPFMWAQASAYRVVGDWRIAFLLPSLLAGLGTLWLVWDLAARLWHRGVAPYAAGALLVSLQFGLQAKRAQIDMLLVFFTSLALWGLLRALLRGPAAHAWWLGGIAAGLGTVTKGVGFLPLLALLPARWLARGAAPRAVWRPPARALAGLLAAFLLGTAVWLLPLLLVLLRSEDPSLHAYASDILLRQTAERYANPWHHHQPVWYYLQVIATLWLPGALLLPWLLPAWWRRLRRGDPRQVVLLGWSALLLLFFSLSPAKREVYIFPALPALCLAAAPLLPGLLKRRAVQRVLLGYVWLLSSLALVAGALGLLQWSRWPGRLLADPQFAVADVGAVWAWLAAIGAGGCLAAATARRRGAAPTLMAFSMLLWLGYGLGLMPALNEASSSRGLMREAGRIIGADAELGLVGWREQQLLQADRAALDFGFERPLSAQWQLAGAWLGQSPTTRWVLALGPLSEPCVDTQRSIPVGRANRRDWVLVPGSAWRRDCRAETRQVPPANAPWWGGRSPRPAPGPPASTPARS